MPYKRIGRGGTRQRSATNSIDLSSCTVLDRVVFVLEAVHAFASGSVDREGAAQFGEALERRCLGGVIGAPALVLAVEPAGWLALEGGFVAETVEATATSPSRSDRQ
jgi:hypothetical protein